MAEGEAQLTLDVLLKRSVRRPLFKTSRSSSLLLVTLLPVYRNKGMKIMKIKHVLTVMPDVVGVLVVARMTFIMIEIGVVLMLGKMSRGQERWCGQWRWI
jgi:hypothetical protein